MNYKMTIQYDGTRYDGWQRQGNTPDTIQGKLEGVLSRMLGRDVEVQGAGRTDAGVHALGQTASFCAGEEPKGEGFLEALNGYLPEDIEVLSLEQAPERFHARLNAVRKTYRYRLALGGRKHVFARRYLWRIPGPLDVEAMEEAARALCGTHDFKSFCANRRMKKSTVRTLEEVVFSFDRETGILDISYTGNGFLYHMVRILTGTLIEVGQGKRSGQEMAQILAARDRQAAGFTAPPCGLTLISVEYGERTAH